MANVTEMPPVEESGIEDPATESTPQAPQPAKPLRGRPPKGQHRPPDARQPQFFDRVASVPKEDWGVRAFMYVYADEPVCQKKTFGETRYILKSSAPILDLEQLKQDYGSFKGWMSLNLRKTGKDATDEVDRLTFEIYDPKHPPKIPRSAWANDDRNKRWADLLPPETPPAPIPAGLAEFTGVFRAASELRKEIREEMQPAQPVQPAQPAPVDPWAAAEKILQMRSDNPMVTILMTRMDAMDKAAEASRLREAELQKELRDQMRIQPQAQPAAAPKTLLEQATEFAEAATKLKSIFTVPGEVAGEAGKVVRAARMGALEFFAEIIPKVAEAPILNAIAARIMAGPAPTDGTPGPVPLAQPQPQPTQPNPQADLEMFLRHTITPALVQAIADKETGANFAQWLWDFLPDRLRQLQNFTHPKLPGLSGPAAIIMAYKHSPVWPSLSINGEEAFALFVQDFCAWKSPDQEQEPETPGPTPFSEPTDQDQETQERV
jgi:hypothetical protein